MYYATIQIPHTFGDMVYLLDSKLVLLSINCTPIKPGLFCITRRDWWNMSKATCQNDNDFFV